MIFFLAAEAMFFAGLISAYWVLRAQVSPWPPAGQPRLPVLVTGINTLILLGSGFTFFGTGRVMMGLTLTGGLTFLSIQGYEWFRLIRFGLTTARNLYAGLFYIVVGAHALHVAAALIVLAVVAFRAARHRYTPGHHDGLTISRMYWSFVVVIWPILYGLVYF